MCASYDGYLEMKEVAFDFVNYINYLLLFMHFEEFLIVSIIIAELKLLNYFKNLMIDCFMNELHLMNFLKFMRFTISLV